MIGFLQALSFLTVVPVPRRASASFGGTAVACFPLIGLLVGGVLAGADAALAVFPAALRSILVVAVWLVVTGALHLDGWIDTWDGLAPGLSREQAHAAMHDPRAGSLGVAGAVLLIATKWAALASLPEPRAVWLVVAAVIARSVVAAALVAAAAPGGDGLGASATAGLGLRHLVVPALAVAGLSALIAWRVLGAALALALLASAALAAVFVRRAGRASGDLFGAIVELSETCVLLVAVAAARP